jgi:hypothetical protein
MTESEELKEQRKHQRLLPKEWVSAFCRTAFFGAGMLVDISMGGVAFRYNHDSGDDWEPLKGSLKMDLFKSRLSQNVVGIDCRVVYDTAVPWGIGGFGDYRLRRCGVEFGELSSDQASELGFFLKDFTVQGN